MDVNVLLHRAADFNDFQDVEMLIQQDEFESAIQECVNQTIADFPDNHDDLSAKKVVFDNNVRERNLSHILNLSGIIAVMFNFLAIFELLNKEHKTIDACRRIYRRMLTICQEILCLSMSGFPDGTFSRWRSLYENYVIIQLLLKNGEDLSDRFLKHSVVSRKNINDAFDKLLAINTTIKDEELYAEYISQYGNTFKENYGWLSEIVPKRNERTFSNICKLVGDENIMAPFYKLSCKVLHANSFSSVMYLGQFDDVIPVGPSEHGNVAPIYLCISTGLNTVGLLSEYAYGKTSVGVFLINYIVQLQKRITSDFDENSQA